MLQRYKVSVNFMNTRVRLFIINRFDMSWAISCREILFQHSQMIWNKAIKFSVGEY